ncbi:heme-thiolate peroxidase [Auricularia subglabra TFB-10046 SS5]|uniref:Heme-thiolate peroxidase n=1 Tax=Auricularia subglabra (strain TFB-10046 / SS5) TaxID=717982 RepID=J0DDH9_AURST|nr:heme-thiolate peroxidase [Auricularia subglabra TFB-10046 SS5]
MLSFYAVPTILALAATGAVGGIIEPFASLAGRTDAEIEHFIRSNNIVGGRPAPGPIADTSAKLVNDEHHPWLSLLPFQIRGPCVCPGLNTLASHGWLPRSGVASPGQIVTAVQEGLNMGWDIAVLITYAAMLVDGNPLTDLLSIGSKTFLTGPAPPKPAIVGGLNTHAVFEGDASMTRGDAFFGDNHSFNETLFNQLVQASNAFGGGKYNISAAAEVRFNRIQQSIATNPEFFFSIPRYATAFAEAVFPIAFFVDGRNTGAAAFELDLTVARGFFQDSRMPRDFHRRDGAFGLDATGEGLSFLINAHFVPPGFNKGIGNYVVDEETLDIFENGFQICALYDFFVNKTVELYPVPKAKGVLRQALAQNLANFFLAVKTASSTCPEQFPYGKVHN